MLLRVPSPGLCLKFHFKSLTPRFFEHHNASRAILGCSSSYGCTKIPPRPRGGLRCLLRSRVPDYCVCTPPACGSGGFLPVEKMLRITFDSPIFLIPPRVVI